MKKLHLLTAAVLAACTLAGCGDTTEDKPVIIASEPIETAAPESTEESVEESTEAAEETDKAETATITDRYVKDGMMQSYLTGEWKDEEVVTRRPMAVMIGNNKALLPQYGISKASIIYEAPVEGRITRLMAIVEDYDDLDRIGPVRSSRDYFVYEAMPYDAIYCNWGLAVPYVEDLLASDRIDNVSQALSGIHNPSAEAFDRVDRGSSYALEYTGYMFIDGYNDAVARHKYATEYRSTFEQAFTFSNDGYTADYEDCDAATKIYPGGTASNKGGYGVNLPSFEYNEEDGLYYRYQFGKEHIDEMNGEQLTVSNVVFKICHGEVRDANDYLAFNCHGDGKAYIFTQGKVIEGTWERAGDNNANMFYDENGDEVIFSQGKTWICNVWEEYADYMSWE